MSYSPNNTPVYLRACAGCFAGLTSSANTDITAADYTLYGLMADAWAQEVDTVWGAATPTNFELLEIEDCSSTMWAGRSPLGAAAGILAGSYNQTALALMARVKQANAQVVAEGVDPSDIGGPSSGPVTPSLNVAFLGDSISNATIPVATVSGSEVLGNYVYGSPNDRVWNGIADNPYFCADSEINTVQGSTDLRLSLIVNQGSYIMWIPQMIRDAFPDAFGIIRIANLAISGASSYSWAGEQAQAFVEFTAPPSPGDTITINGVMYTFVASAVSPFQVAIGSADQTATNLMAAVNADPANTAGWGAGTTQHPNCFSPYISGGQIEANEASFSAVATGTAGNANTLTTTSAGISILQPFSGGSPISAIYANAKARMAKGFVPDVIAITLGTNDSGIEGWRGRGFESEMQTLIDNCEADFPGVPLMIWRPISGVSFSQEALMATVVPAVDALVLANPNVSYSSDIFTLGAGTGDTAILSPVSGLHPTEYGNAVIAEEISASICHVVGLDVAPTSAAWIPSEAPGCYIWLTDPDIYYTITEIGGLPTGVWKDLSGGGRNATAGATNPALSSSGGQPVVQFTATSSDFLEVPSVGLVSPIYLWIVCRWTDIVYTGNQYASDGTAINSMALIRNGTNSVAINGGAVLVWSAASPTVLTAYGLDFDGATSSIAANGVIKASGAGGSTSPGGLTLGAFGSGGGLFGNLEIAEVVVFTTPPSVGTLTNLNAYRLAKYGF